MPSKPELGSLTIAPERAEKRARISPAIPSISLVMTNIWSEFAGTKPNPSIGAECSQKIALSQTKFCEMPCQKLVDSPELL
jgi:hypothetical protein